MKLPKKIILFILILGVFFSYLIIARKMTIPFIYRIKPGSNYTIGTFSTNSPLTVNYSSIVTIDRDGFGIQPAPEFMADPFVVKDKSCYYIFFEQLSAKNNASKGANIAVLKSNDLKNWEHLGIVLDEPFHLSYPNVFKYKNKWYMLPEAGASNEVRLYETDNFPYDWKLKKVLLKGIEIYDPTLIFKDSMIYMLGMNNDKLRLFFSKNLESNWIEHPASPVREGYLNGVRPGGSPGVFNDSLYYFVQDNTYNYGSGLIAYRIDSISPTFFRDERIKKNPVLFRHGSGWASSGMHQLSWVKEDDQSYFCVVDGIQSHGLQWGCSWRNLPEFMFK